MGWSLNQVEPVWIYPKYDWIFPKCDWIFPNIAGFYHMDYTFFFQVGLVQLGLLV